MQWLIDLVIEAIGIPPVYIDRGDPAAADFTLVNFTRDNAWHDLDLSAIVPAGAQAVNLRIYGNNSIVSSFFDMRRNGNVNPRAISQFYTQVANLPYACDFVVAIDSNRIVEYRAFLVGWTALICTVKGWWL